MSVSVELVIYFLFVCFFFSSLLSFGYEIGMLLLKKQNASCNFSPQTPPRSLVHKHTVAFYCTQSERLLSTYCTVQ